MRTPETIMTNQTQMKSNLRTQPHFPARPEAAFRWWRLVASERCRNAGERKIRLGGPRGLQVRGQGRRGASIVEFALVFLLLMLVVLGLMDLGRGIWTYTTVAQASREASRYIMVHGSANRTTAADIENVVARHAIGLDASKLQVSTSYDDEDSKRGDTVDVSVRYDFQLLTAPLVLQSGTITLAANSRTVLAN